MSLSENLKKLNEFKATLTQGAKEGVDKGSELLSGFSKQITTYERKLLGLLKELDGARFKSRKHLNEFLEQVQKAKKEVEKKVVEIVNQEGKRLNANLVDLLNRLKSEAMQSTPKSGKGSKKKTSRKKSTKKKPTSSRAKVSPGARAETTTEASPA